MKRPYVILVVSSSIDGRISLGPNRTMMDMDERDSVLGTEKDWKTFTGRLEHIHDPDVWMEGSNMLVKEGQKLRELEPFSGDKEMLYEDFLPDEMISRPDRKGWLAVVDGRGRLRSGFTGEEHKPIVHLVSHNVPPEYLAFLRNKKNTLPYRWDERVDLKKVLEKMKSKLEVEKVLTSSGGKLSGALLKEGLLDEINIRFNPVIIGGYETPILFASPDLKQGEWPKKLEHIMTQIEPDGSFWVRYKVLYE
ncbi:MAG: dihydrofolate reductase family protein [Candidatus Saliniplasma sp.]